MNDLIKDIRTFCTAAGIKPTTFGLRAVNDGGFVPRLDAGGQCLPRTVEKVRAYMRANPPAASKAEAQSA
jgi:hypothetical protein